MKKRPKTLISTIHQFFEDCISKRINLNLKTMAKIVVIILFVSSFINQVNSCFHVMFGCGNPDFHPDGCKSRIQCDHFTLVPIKGLYNVKAWKECMREVLGCNPFNEKCNSKYDKGLLINDVTNEGERVYSLMMSHKIERERDRQ